MFSNLYYIYLGGWNLTGTVPANLKVRYTLDLSRNRLTGSLPTIPSSYNDFSFNLYVLFLFLFHSFVLCALFIIYIYIYIYIFFFSI